MAKFASFKTVPKINLLPRDPFYDTVIGKIMVWAIQVGRYIIVFTEIIVIMSFASRFKLDRDLTDLTSQITQKKSIVASFGEVEAKTRQIQSKISTVSKLISDKNAVYYLDRLTARIPAGVQLTQLSYEGTVVSFSGTADTSGTLATMITSLQQEPYFTGVAVDRINSGEANDPTVQFSVKLSLPAPTGTVKDQPITATPTPISASPSDAQ